MPFSTALTRQLGIRGMLTPSDLKLIQSRRSTDPVKVPVVQGGMQWYEEPPNSLVSSEAHEYCSGSVTQNWPVPLAMLEDLVLYDLYA